MCKQPGWHGSINRHEPGALPLSTPTSPSITDWVLRRLPGLVKLFYHGGWPQPPVRSQMRVLTSLQEQWESTDFGQVSPHLLAASRIHTRRAPPSPKPPYDRLLTGSSVSPSHPWAA